MPLPQVELAGDLGTEELRAGLDRIREELRVPGEHSEAAEEEAVAAAERALAGLRSPGRRDALDIDLVTIDPPGSMDLDQALHIERRGGGGWRVRYAVADVGSFVAPGGQLDGEVTERGLTYYLPDRRAPLHPPVIGEGAGSLLPGEERPAALWTIDLDAGGSVLASRVERAVVRSRRRLTYTEAQAEIDSGRAPESLALLAEVGTARLELEAARGGVSLDLPAQKVVLEPGEYRLEYERTVPCMRWNAQISLLTGIVAAEAMVEAGVGLLRTLPPPDPRVVAELESAARALGVRWSDGAGYADAVRGLRGDDPEEAALLNVAARALRGAGYLALVPGTPPPERPEQLQHSAVASVYAHVTAPLRRLCDRHATEVCLALHAGQDPPAGIVAALADLPAVMASAGGRSSAVSRAAVDLVEALLLREKVGQELPAVVVVSDDDRSTVVIDHMAVRADVDGQELPLGEQVVVRVAEVDPVARRVHLVAV